MSLFQFSQWKDEFSRNLKGDFYIRSYSTPSRNKKYLCVYHEAWIQTFEGMRMPIASSGNLCKLQELCENWLTKPENSKFLA